MPVFLISLDILEANILTEFWGATPPSTPQTDPLKINFLNSLSWNSSFYLILWNTEKTNTWTYFESATPQKSPNEPHKNQFFNDLI